MSIGQHIKEARLKAGITQAELANKLGIAYQSIGQWERGLRTPKIETLRKIAEVLGMDVNWLMNGQTLEQRDQGMKDYVARRFTEAELNAQMQKAFDSLSVEGKQEAVRSINIIAGNPQYQKK